MQVLLRHTLKSGREVYLDSFYMEPTPFGVPSASTPLEQSVRNLISRVYRDCEAVILGLPAALPFVCLGTFTSAPIDDHDATCSVLLLCWFVSNPNSRLSELVKAGIAGLDWEAHAVNSYV